MTELWNLLDELEATSGKAKQGVLKRILSLPDGEEYIRWVFNGVVYGLSDQTLATTFNADIRPDVTINMMEQATGNDSEFSAIDPSHVTGHALQEFLKSSFIDFSPRKTKWIARGLLHDLKSGATIKTVNKVLRSMKKEEIYVFEVQLAGKWEKAKFDYPVFVEEKYDGVRAYVEVKNGNVQITSRHGNSLLEKFPKIAAHLATLFPKEHVILDGEIVSTDFQLLSTRVHRNEADNDIPLKYVVFDCLWYGEDDVSKRNQHDRRHFVEACCYGADEDIVCESNLIKAQNEEELDTFYSEIISKGGEGVIVKNLDKPYESGSRKHWWKRKPKHTVDLKIYDFEMGNGRKSNVIGSLHLIDKSEEIKCRVGSGLSDDWSQTLTEMHEKGELIGKIVEIEYFEITRTNGIRFPRFITLRTDKSEPDRIQVG